MPIAEAAFLAVVVGFPLAGAIVAGLKGREVLAMMSSALTVAATGLVLIATGADAAGMPELGITAAYIPGAFLLLGWAPLAGLIRSARPGSLWWRNCYRPDRRLKSAVSSVGLMGRSSPLLPPNALQPKVPVRTRAQDVPSLVATLRLSLESFGYSVMTSGGLAGAFFLVVAVLPRWQAPGVVLQAGWVMMAFFIMCVAQTVLSHAVSTAGTILRHSFAHTVPFAFVWVVGGFLVALAATLARLLIPQGSSGSMPATVGLLPLWLAVGVAIVVGARFLGAPALVVRGVTPSRALATSWGQSRFVWGRAILLTSGVGLAYGVMVTVATMLAGSWWGAGLIGLVWGSVAAVAALAAEVIWMSGAAGCPEDVAAAVSAHAARACIRGSEGTISPRRRRLSGG